MYYRIAADTNILFSGLYFGGKPGEIIKLVLENDCSLHIPEYIKDELEEVAYKKGADLKSIYKLIELNNVYLITDSDYDRADLLEKVRKICRDRSDYPVLAFALYALKYNIIDFFITGDKDLLTEKVREVAGGRIATVAEFLDKTKTPLSP